MVKTTISVLIADDHTVVRKGLASLLSSEKYGIRVIGEAMDGNEAIQKALELKPDVILLDLIMPRKNGIEAIREIKKSQPEARILVLTSFADDKKVLEALRAGAYGFLLKDTTPDELVQTIRAVSEDRLSLPRDLVPALVGGRQKLPSTQEPIEELTERERDVLRCLAQGMSNKQIASQLSIGANTVRSHVSSMMRKLNLENRTQLALYAREQGLV